MGMRYPDSRNRRSIEDGAAFEQYVIERLARSGIILTFCNDVRRQFLYGDTEEGIEIKLDARSSETHRLSIEIAERTSLHADWVRSGIFAKHHATRYAQGTEKLFYLFHVDTLRQWYQMNRPTVIKDNPPTIAKFYLPIHEAKRIAESMWTGVEDGSYTDHEADQWLYAHGYTRNAECRWVNPKGEVY